MKIQSFSSLLFLSLSQTFFDYSWGFEEVIKFCGSNGFKFVTFAGINSTNHRRFVKKASLLGIRTRFLNLDANFDYVKDKDMLVRNLLIQGSSNSADSTSAVLDIVRFEIYTKLIA